MAAFDILPISRLSSDPLRLTRSDSGALDESEPPPLLHLANQILTTYQTVINVWLRKHMPFVSSQPDHSCAIAPHSHACRETDICPDCPPESMIVTAFILEHAGAITNSSGRPQKPSSAAIVPARVSSKRNLSVNEKREDDDDDEREPDDESNRHRSAKRVRADDTLPVNQISFACPFFKMDPIRHQACLFYKMSKISYVKQHLQRTHRGPRWRCPQCQDAFQDQTAYNRHLTAQECQRSRTKARQDEMSEGQWEEIGRLTSRRAGATTESMWYAMFEVLFPGAPRPDTPYIESGILEMTRHFRDYVRERGPHIIRRQLETTGDWQRVADSLVDPDQLLHHVLGSGIDLVFSNWSRSMESEGVRARNAGETRGPQGHAETDALRLGQFAPTSQSLTEAMSLAHTRSRSESGPYLPPVSSFYGPNVVGSVFEPGLSPPAYHVRVPSTISVSDTPLMSEASIETMPRTLPARDWAPRSSGSDSIGTAAETVPGTPSRGVMSISALTRSDRQNFDPT